MILLTCAHGERYEHLQRITAEHHAILFPCLRPEHKGRPADFPCWHSNWLKVYWLRKLLASAPIGEQILYLDSDVLIRRAFELEKVIPEGFDFAAVRNVWDEYNVGVMFWRVTEKTRALINQVYITGPHSIHPHADQLIFNMYINNCRHFQLPARYNCYRHARGDNTDPLILSWHGDGIEAAIRGVEECLASK